MIKKSVKKLQGKPVPKKIKLAPKGVSTLVNFILDETGSMESCKTETISGFNEYIGTLKETRQKEKQDILFSLTKFNSGKTDAVYTAEPVEYIKELSTETYVPGNMTPLYDAIGVGISKTAAELKAKKLKPKVLFVIMTDGAENASKEYDRKKIFDLIKKQEKENWSFIFLGADQDSWLAGESIGLSRGNTMNYVKEESIGTFSALGASTAKYVKACECNTKDFFKETGYDVKKSPVKK